MKKTTGAKGRVKTSEPKSLNEAEERAVADNLARLRGHAGEGPSTDEIMSGTRGDH